MELPRNQRSPATLALWLNKILAGAAHSLPLLAELGGGMERQTRWDTGRIGRALQTLQASLGGLPLDGRGADEAVAHLRLQLAEVDAGLEAFLQASASGALALRPVLSTFQQEFRGTEKLVERGAEWLEEMTSGVESGRAMAGAEVSRRAYDVLEARAAQLRQRHGLLQDASRSARNVHALADNLARTRAALEQAVRFQLPRVGSALQERLARAGRLPSRELLAARSDAQTRVAQALELLGRLQGSRDRLVREQALLHARCGKAAPPEPGREPAGLARIVLPQPEEAA